VFYLDPGLADWTEPPGLQELVANNFEPLLLHLEPTGTGTTIARGAFAIESPVRAQDPCRPPFELGSLTPTPDGHFTTAPAEAWMQVRGQPLTVRELTLEGHLSDDGQRIERASISGLFDVRELRGHFMADGGGFCAMVEAAGASCVPCPGDREPRCIRARAEGIESVADTSLSFATSHRPPASCAPEGHAPCVPRDLSPRVAGGGAERGYTLLALMGSTETSLIDTEGRTVHRWTHPAEAPLDLVAKLRDDGRLLRTVSLGRPGFHDAIPAIGVEEYSWDGELLWSYELGDRKRALHHDLAPLPNGNVLLLAYERVTRREAIALGWDPEQVPQSGVWAEAVIELRPEPPTGGTIVWEWRIVDHLIQTHDPDKPDFATPADRPERLDLGAAPNQLGPDWLHINSLDYNAARDEILLSVFTTSEIVVIDHSTSSEAAAGSTGGQRGQGGDLLFRWGHPAIWGGSGP